MTEAFVDIWQGNLAEHAGRLHALMALLSDTELAKAQTLQTEQAKMHYIVSRGLLRTTLAGYLHCGPRELEFSIGEHGKPTLLGHDLAFNLSHSQDSLLLAVSNLQTVGVDVETIKPRKSLQGIAQRCFSAGEFKHWQQLPSAEQTGQFFRLWTIKEAFVKAVGRGIALGLDHCEVDIGSHRGFSAVPDEYGPAATWLVTELNLGEQVAAALVTANCHYQLRCFEF
jgi:4'-phosphopantetheinyl transferase